MKSELVIRQPYHVTISGYDFNIYEERVFLSVLKEIQPYFSFKTSHMEYIESLKENEKDVIIQFKIRDLMLAKSGRNKEVANALDGLISKKIKIKGYDKKYGDYDFCSSLILEYKYFRSKEFVKLKISSEMMSYLCASMSNYTKYSLNVAFRCSSPYTIRLYKYLSHYSDFSEKNKLLTITVLQLRSWLCLGEKYKRPNAIKQKILIPAQKELESTADVWFEIISPIKESRKVVGWKLKIHQKKSKKPSVKNLEAGKKPPTPSSLPPELEPIDMDQTLAEIEKLKAKTKS